MKEPERIPLDPSTPRIPDVKRRPLPSLEQEANKTYPEPMRDDVVSGGAEQSFFNFIQKAKESKRKYNERLKRIEDTSKDK
jgi:hypothetical protein